METALTQTAELATELRRARGLEIAKHRKIKARRPGVYAVPSASFQGDYIVLTETTDGHGAECNCPDFELRNAPCKHIFAVEFQRRTEVMSDGSVKTESTLKVTYTQNWSAYNKAQTVEQEHVAKLLRGLCDELTEPPQEGRGERRLPIGDRVWALTMKVYDGKSSRRNDTNMREWAAKGFLSKAPSYNAICHYMEDANLFPVLSRLVDLSAAPLAAVETQFAADSSGFSTCTYRRWYDQKYGTPVKSADWIKAHVMVGTRTNVVTHAKITDNDTNDCPVLPSLIDGTAKRFHMDEISADKGYLSNQNMHAIEAAGAVPYIAFKKNSTSGSQGSTELWNRMFHYFQFNRTEYLAHYHRRSNVETTFHMVKAKFGGSLRSKSFPAQRNELLCKLLCHNLAVLTQEMHELGIMPTFFPQADAAPVPNNVLPFPQR